jgi:hypothetical protein
MSKFYVVKDLISLSNYAKKYKVSLRKIYRYIGDELIEHYMIDGVAFLPDKLIPILKETHTKNQLQNSVKNLTKRKVSVKDLTSFNTEELQLSENEIVGSVKILTESGEDNVKILTIREDDLKLMVTPENKLSINGMKARIALLENYGLR